jgi:hypothetical protein
MDRIRARICDLDKPLKGMPEHGWLWWEPSDTWRYSCMLRGANPPSRNQVLFLEFADGRFGPMKVAFIDPTNSAVEFEGLGPLLFMAQHSSSPHAIAAAH